MSDAQEFESLASLTPGVGTPVEILRWLRMT
jgi:hypothetical protein